MKKIISLLLVLILFLGIFSMPALGTELELTAESAILMEVSSGKIIYEKDPDKILRPASITKIMTLILIFDALDSGKINRDDLVTVSANAASMGGSQVYLEEGEQQTVETLIKCIAIASANDACVAMAEFIDGTEEAFVANMNERALGLNMNNTHFVNCCGLDTDGHTTTARDVALMSKELITKYPEIHNISTIWMDTITHVTRQGSKDFTLTNTNKLIKQYEYATGLKTGSTSLAGFCLAATAKKNNIELISVVMASSSGKTRVSDSIKLLNTGFANCSIYEDKSMPQLVPLKIKGINSPIELTYKNNFNYVFIEKYDESLITSSSEFFNNLKPPIHQGQVLGALTYYYDNMPIGSVDIIASKEYKKSSYGNYLGLLIRELINI